MNTTNQNLETRKDKMTKSVGKQSTPRQNKFVKKQFILNGTIKGKSLMPASQLDKCSPEM